MAGRAVAQARTEQVHLAAEAEVECSIEECRRQSEADGDGSNHSRT
jgi:hypothetical protein